MVALIFKKIYCGKGNTRNKKTIALWHWIVYIVHDIDLVKYSQISTIGDSIITLKLYKFIKKSCIFLYIKFILRTLPKAKTIELWARKNKKYAKKGFRACVKAARGDIINRILLNKCILQEKS